MTVLSDPPRVRKQVVVCLEDDRDLARLIQVTLRPWTRAFHLAYDGIHGLDLIRQEQPDLILLDLNLPRRDGREVLQEIKADPDLRRIPVVVLTTSQAEEDVLRSYDLHANAYVTKPVDFERFVDVVRQVDEFFFTVVRLPGSTV